MGFKTVGIAAMTAAALTLAACGGAGTNLRRLGQRFDERGWSRLRHAGGLLLVDVRIGGRRAEACWRRRSPPLTRTRRSRTRPCPAAADPTPGRRWPPGCRAATRRTPGSCTPTRTCPRSSRTARPPTSPACTGERLGGQASGGVEAHAAGGRQVLRRPGQRAPGQRVVDQPRGAEEGRRHLTDDTSTTEFVADLPKLKAAGVTPVCLGDKDPFAPAQLLEVIIMANVGADG